MVACWGIVLFGVGTLNAEPSIIISEFMAAKDSVFQDSEGSYTDWIELYNFGTEPVDLGGLHLTDSKKDLTRYKLPSSVLEPG